jgi:glycerophosphoryl diester phosphodiesterase
VSVRPLIFAHRGASDEQPEHTLGAYLRAIADGADGLECDVRLTRDGHLVCLHDRRLERTSDGRGLVSSRTLAELDALDFASWHPAAVGAEPIRDDHRRVLTFDRLLTVAQEAGRPLRLLVETKHPSRFGAAVERTLVDVLRRHGLDRDDPTSPVRVTVMSFSPFALRLMRRLAPQVPTVMLLELVPPPLRTGHLPVDAPIGGPSIGLLRSSPHLADRLHARGRQVYVWTVNEAADLELVRSLGVEGIITDRPGFVRRLLDAGEGRRQTV